MDLRQWGTSKINDAGVPTKTEQSEGLASDSLWIVHFQLDPYYLQLVAIYNCYTYELLNRTYATIGHGPHSLVVCCSKNT